MLSAPSQLLLRNEEIFRQGKWLLVNPADSDIFNQLPAADVEGFHQYFDLYQRCQADTSNSQHFGATLTSEHRYQGIVIYMPKAKAQLRMLLANMATLLAADGLLLIVGENKSGIKSVGKLLADLTTRVNKLDSARHCSLVACILAADLAPFQLADWWQYHSVKVNDVDIEVASLPGVFSHGELDAGTELLLLNAPQAHGKVLDFACGAGVIGAYLSKQYPTIQLQMSDVSALAVAASEQTLQRNGLSAQVVAANGISDLANDYDAIYTNPPFHSGVKTDYSITNAFIHDAGQQLKSGGQLTLVANRFIAYPDLLQQAFGQFSVIAQNGKFNLYHCVN